jgi:LacI family transcriptional regulator
MTKGAITLYDIAKRAKVSHVTVSNALRNLNGEVSERQAARIRKLATRMGYAPNLAARNLVSGRTQTVTLITTSGLRHPHVHEMIEHLQAELNLRQYHLNLEQTPNIQDMETVFRTLSRGRCDGVVVFMLSDLLRERLEGVRKKGLPVVAIDPGPDAPFDCVDYDRAEAMRLATSHLLEQGCGRIAIILGQFHGLYHHLFVQGYRAALEAAGQSFDESLIFDWNVGDDPARLWREMKAAHANLAGIISFNEQLMTGLLHAIRMDGRRVPEEIALVTVGNSWLIELAEVPLTAIDMNRAEISKKVVECLLEQIQKPNIRPRHLLVKPHLVVRASSCRITPPHVSQPPA